MKLFTTPVLLLVALAVALPAAPPSSTAEVVTRLNQASQGFESITATLKRLNYTAVVRITETEAGTLRMGRAKGNTRLVIDLTSPNQKTIFFHDRKLEIFYPKAKLVEEYDLGKASKLVDQFLLLGFGTSGSELKAAYDLTLTGAEKINGLSTWKLQLVPKSKEARAQLAKVELWITDDTTETLQQKFFMPSGDYQLVTYSDLRRNAPLANDALALKLPADVQRARPQK